MKRLNLGLLYGGESSERDVSIAGWNVVKDHFDTERFHLVHFDLKTDLLRLISEASNLDAAFICLHGRGGEDGTLQGLLELLGVPYQGSGVLASALAMNKMLSKALFRHAGLDVAPDMVVTREDRVDPVEVEARIGFPLMVKPVTEGSSVGATLVRSPSELEAAVEKAFLYDRQILLEQYLRGMEITGAVLGNERLRALPIVEIAPAECYDFFDKTAKYTPGATRETCPAPLDPDTTRKAQETALTAHRILQCRGYSRVDMFVCGDRIFVLEVNTIPGMTETSLFPLAAGQAGISFPRLLEILVELALGGELD